MNVIPAPSCRGRCVGVDMRRVWVGEVVFSCCVWSAEQSSYCPAGENPAKGKASHHLRTEPHIQSGNRLRTGSLRCLALFAPVVNISTGGLH